MLNFVVFMNIIIFSCKFCSGAISKLVESTSRLQISMFRLSIPYGKPIASLISIISKPFSFIGGFYKIIIVIDIVLLVIWIISNFRRKMKVKSIIETQTTQGTSGEMNIFK